MDRQTVWSVLYDTSIVDSSSSSQVLVVVVDTFTFTQQLMFPTHCSVYVKGNDAQYCLKIGHCHICHILTGRWSANPLPPVLPHKRGKLCAANLFFPDKICRIAYRLEHRYTTSQIDIIANKHITPLYSYKYSCMKPAKTWVVVLSSSWKMLSIPSMHLAIAWIHTFVAANYF